MPATSSATTKSRPNPRWTGLAGSLNREWDTELRGREPVSPDGTPWATTAPALTGCTSTEQVLDVIRGGTRVVHDQVLHALLTRHAAGDTLAGRTVLQAFLGRLPRMTRTAIARGLDDPHAAAAEALWKAIASYPLHRTSRVAANLALEALAALDPQRDATMELPAGQLLDAHVHRAQHTGRTPTVGSDPLEDAAYALTWADERGVLTESEIRLLARVHLADRRPPMALIAQELGCSYDAARQRHCVAVGKLADAVRASLRDDQSH